MINHVWKVLWEIWRDSQHFKREVMKVIYIALNKRRPSWISEIIINDWESKGPSPHFYNM